MGVDRKSGTPRWILIATGVAGLAAAVLAVGAKYYELHKARVEAAKVDGTLAPPESSTPAAAAPATLPISSPQPLRLKTGDDVRLKCLSDTEQAWWLVGNADDGSVKLVNKAQDRVGTVWRVYVERAGTRLVYLQKGKPPAWFDSDTIQGRVLCLRNDGRGSGSNWDFVNIKENQFEIRSLGHIEGYRWLDGNTANGSVRLRNKQDVPRLTRWHVEVVNTPP